MLIVIALVFGATVGAILHFTLAERDTRGPALAPILATIIAGGVWLLFTWLGFADTGWIWLASLAAPIVLTWVLMVLITRLRLRHDRLERERLKIA